jgi:3-deoxy-D-manno-octulosonate 8-phosphate phosphatase (KDO 8-P phosphatase)
MTTSQNVTSAITSPHFNNVSKTILAKASKIKLALFDVDGVLTDGRIYIGNNGEEHKDFHTQDGLGLKLLQKSGVAVGLITSRQSSAVTIRAEQLGIKHIYQGQTEKEPAYEELLNKLHCCDEEVAYVGDDLPDLRLICRAGLGIAVANAVPLICQFADWQTNARGGQGAVREICELIMHAQQTLTAAITSFQ